MTHRESHEVGEIRQEIADLRMEMKEAKRQGVAPEIRSVKRALIAREKDLSNALAVDRDGW